MPHHFCKYVCLGEWGVEPRNSVVNATMMISATVKHFINRTNFTASCGLWFKKKAPQTTVEQWWMRAFWIKASSKAEIYKNCFVLNQYNTTLYQAKTSKHLSDVRINTLHQFFYVAALAPLACLLAALYQAKTSKHLSDVRINTLYQFFYVAALAPLACLPAFALRY